MESYQRLNVVTNLDVDESATADVARRVTLKRMVVNNKNAAVLYVKLYDKATAATVGTDTPKLTLGCGVTATVGAEKFDFEEGILFDNGISLGATTAAAVADTGAPGANDCLVTLFYE